jgi:hypothetical protein
MNNMKKALLALMVLLIPGTVCAQLISVQPGTGRVATTKTKKAKKVKKEKEPKTVKVVKKEKEPKEVKTVNNGVEASIKADIVSQYIWRGLDLSGLSFQPTATVSWKGLSLTAEGSTSINQDDYRDIDITLGYQLGPVNIGVTDYWCTGIDVENRYMYFDQHNGAHILEGNLGFTCKYFTLQGYCMFWGNDFKIDPNGRAYTEDRAYSTYIELSVPFRLADLDWQVTVGGTPMESGGDWETQSRETLLGLKDVDVRVYEYADGPACCSATLRCTKTIGLGNVSLPLFAEVNANPYMSRASLLFGLSIVP